MLPHRLGGISPGLLVMPGIQLEPHESGISGVEHARDFARRLAQRAHVIVVAEWDAQLGAAPADLREQAAHAAEIVGCRLPARRARVDHLEIAAAHVADEAGVAGVLRQRRLFGRRIE